MFGRLKKLEAKLARTINRVQVLWKERFEAIEKSAKRAEDKAKQTARSNEFKWKDILQRLNLLEQVNKTGLEKVRKQNEAQEARDPEDG